MPIIMLVCVEWMAMRTTLSLDDELLRKAQSYTGLREKSALIREALRKETDPALIRLYQDILAKRDV